MHLSLNVSIHRGWPGLITLLLLARVTIFGQTTPSSSSPNELIVLSPFSVATTEDKGYLATNSASATRINLTIQDTPMAVSVVTREFMDDIGGTDLTKGLSYSGVNADHNSANASISRSSDASFTVRGLQGAALFRDGFSAFGMVDTANIERVELVKGPASVFYGNASPGGLINYVTKQPTTKAFASVRTLVGSYDYYRGELDYNQPLNDDKTLAFRLNTSAVDAGSFRRFEKTRSQFVAPAVSWSITPSTTIRTSLEYYNLHKIEPGPIPEIQVGANLVSLYKQLPLDYNLNGPDAVNDRSKLTSTTVLDHSFSSKVSTRVSFNYWEDKTRSLTRGDNVSFDPTTLPTVLAYIKSDETRYAIRNDWLWAFETGQVSHKLILGGEHSYDDNFLYNLLSTPTVFNPLNFANLPLSAFAIPGPTDPAFNVSTTIRTRSETLGDAGYASDIITAFDGRLTTLIGGRMDRIKLTNVVTNISGSRSKFSPQVSGLYKVTSEIGVYASYSTSLSPNGLSTDGKLFPPLEGIGKEGGLKLDLLNHRFVGTISVFEITRKNIPVTVFTPTQNGLGIQTFAAGEQRSRGWDTDWVVTVTDDFQMVLNYLNCNPVITKGRAGATADAISPDEGQPTSRGQRYQASVWGKYTFSKGKLKGFYTGAGVVYEGPFRIRGLALGLPKDSLEFSPISARVDAAVGYSFKLAGHSAKLGLSVQNVLDRRYLTAQSYSPIRAAPRSFLGSAEIKF